MIEVAVTDAGSGLLQRRAAWASANASELKITEATIAELLRPGAKRPDIVLLEVIDQPGTDPAGDVKRLRAAGIQPLAITHDAGDQALMSRVRDHHGRALRER